jgi:hypothetical protein
LIPLFDASVKLFSSVFLLKWKFSLLQ